MSTPSRPVVPARLVGALAAHPELWLTALRTGALLAEPGWWRRWPPLPRPPGPYGEFRLQTMFGTASGAALAGDDLIAYLRWCRRMRGLR